MKATTSSPKLTRQEVSDELRRRRLNKPVEATLEELAEAAHSAEKRRSRRDFLRKAAFGGAAGLGAFLLGDRLLSTSDTLAQDNQEDSVNQSQRTADYTIYKKAASFYAMNGQTGLVEFSGTNGRTVLQNAIDAISDDAPRFGGTIILEPSVRIDATITISKENIAIVSDAKPHDEAKQPGIQKIVVDSTSKKIQGFRLDGISVRELEFNANGNEIRGIWVDNCEIVPGTAANQGGIRFTGSTLVQMAQFTNCIFWDYNSGGGAINYEGTGGGTGHHVYANCSYLSKAVNATTFRFAADAFVGMPIWIDNCSFVNRTPDTGYKPFHIEGHATSNKGIPNLMITNLYLEIDEQDVDIFTIDDSSAGVEQYFFCTIMGLHILPKSGTGNTRLIVNNRANTYWDGTTEAGLTVLGGHLDRKTNTFSLGTPNEGTRFRVVVKDLHGFNPQGVAAISVGASPFTYQNADSVPEAVYIDGGTVSDISRDAMTVFTGTPALVWLEPRESVTVTYSAPPTMKRDRK